MLGEKIEHIPKKNIQKFKTKDLKIKELISNNNSYNNVDSIK
jgi:hypothetical protein